MNPDNSTDAQSQSAHREGLKLLTAHPLSPYPSLLLSPVSPVDRPASAPPSRSSVMSAYDDFVKQLATGEHPTCSTQELLSLAPVATQFPLAQKIEQTVQARHAGTKTKLRSALTGKSGQELEEMILQAYKCILMRTSEIEALASIANASLRDLGALRARLEAATQLQPIENDRPAPANLGHASSSSPTHGMSQGASVTRIAQSKRPASPDGPYKEAAQTQTRQHATQIVRPISGNSMPPIFISRSVTRRKSLLLPITTGSTGPLTSRALPELISPQLPEYKPPTRHFRPRLLALVSKDTLNDTSGGPLTPEERGHITVPKGQRAKVLLDRPHLLRTFGKDSFPAMLQEQDSKSIDFPVGLLSKL